MKKEVKKKSYQRNPTKKRELWKSTDHLGANLFFFSTGQDEATRFVFDLSHEN